MRQISLPAAPNELSGPVKAWKEPVTIPTYAAPEADRNPMFLEKRVYQGSSGECIRCRLSTGSRMRTSARGPLFIWRMNSSG